MAAAVVAAGGPAFAGPMFSDYFDTANGGTPVLNWNGSPNWVVSAGTVDLIGSGSGGTSFNFYPGNGLYIDLDGTSGDAGVFSTAVSFTPGIYDISFALGGSTRGDTNTVTVSLGNWSETFTLASSDPLVTYTRTVSTSGGPLSFSNAGGDNVGLILDNVSVADRVTAAAVPEPISLVVFGGLTVFGGLVARRRMKA
jgi:hypothetical protein